MADFLCCHTDVKDISGTSTGKSVATVEIRRYQDEQITHATIQVAVAGDSESGKSTIIGVLAKGV